MQHPVRTGCRTRQTQKERPALQLIDAAETLMLFIFGQARRPGAASLECLLDADQLPRSYLLTLVFAQYTVVCPIDLIQDVPAADAPGARDVYEPLGKTFAFDSHLIKLLIISRRLVKVGVSQWSRIRCCGKAHLSDRQGNVEQKLGFPDHSQRGVIRQQLPVKVDWRQMWWFHWHSGAINR